MAVFEHFFPLYSQDCCFAYSQSSGGLYYPLKCVSSMNLIL